jgi:Uncharacterised protein family (UPF0158)
MAGIDGRLRRALRRDWEYRTSRVGRTPPDPLFVLKSIRLRIQRDPAQYHDLEVMPATVRLNDIVDALEMQFDRSSSFLDRETGEVVTVSNDLLGDAEECDDDEEPDLPAWQQKEWEIARRIVSTGRFRRLPTKFDVHEWSIMEDFSHSVESDRIRQDLLDAIHGAGAFRYFKDTLRRHRIESAWSAFRAEALRQIALDWCKENHIVWE